MARAKKAITKQVVIQKNPAIFTEDETVSYRKSLIQELTWQGKSFLSEVEIIEMAESVLNRNEKTTLWLRKNGVLQMSRLLLQRHKEEAVPA